MYLTRLESCAQDAGHAAGQTLMHYCSAKTFAAQLISPVGQFIADGAHEMYVPNNMEDHSCCIYLEFGHKQKWYLTVGSFV